MGGPKMGNGGPWESHSGKWGSPQVVGETWGVSGAPEGGPRRGNGRSWGSEEGKWESQGVPGGKMGVSGDPMGAGMGFPAGPWGNLGVSRVSWGSLEWKWGFPRGKQELRGQLGGPGVGGTWG